MTVQPHSLLRLRGIGKTYVAPVLQDVDLEFHEGEVLGLAGENGAGKSTLSRIVGGLLAATSGTMEFLGDGYKPANRREAEHLGVRMVLQELSLVSTLSIAENLFLDALPRRFGLLDRQTLHERARPLMARVGLDGLDPGVPVGQLGIGQQQMVEIARGLIGQCRLLILDEPSAMLTDRETELLFAQINQLRDQGVSLVYISHRLDEIKRLADRIAILRDGRLVEVRAASEMQVDDIVRAMVGREVGNALDLADRSIGGPILEVRNLSRGHAVRDVSFSLRQGEILGFAGLVGSGRTELMRLLFGADHRDSGEVLLEGLPFNPRSPRQAVQAGIAMITEDRKEQGLLLPLAISTNVTLANLASVSTAGWIDQSAEVSVAGRLIDELKVRCRGGRQAVKELSGGNQQKVVLARWLYRDCEVLLLDEPTRGIDIGARYEIYGLLAALSRRGKSLIVISSDLRELMLLCDRISVMSAGRLVATFERGAWDQDAILTAAFSGHLQTTSQELA
ncbi:sugar ABC transporter ATP-binding protein [Telmatospirillum sp.]|uniref:sugar ABC transporter ATP-binding protein n=1 Tax=Telmatospirillum sp. TaxID=2079197 RepID=UPI00283E5CB8|nr:sugar ABC transporter ATP-binding protein [Telmatospirillum sp.]MDR3435572.1 sugar ABC transporter ATP-binding protein [Telmatospirillum sp.]